MRKILLPFSILIAFSSLAQEAQFTQFFNTPPYLNPALTGDCSKHRFGAAYRNQWPGIKKAYSTYMAAYDFNLDDKNLGIGGYVLEDISGTMGIATTQAALNVAYRMNAGDRAVIRAGLQGAFGQKQLNTGKLVFNDQFITGASASEDVPGINSKTFVDIGAGAVIKADNFTGGVVARHLNKPDISMSGKSQSLPVWFGLHAAYSIKMKSDTGRNKEFLQILANFNHETVNDKLDIGALYYIKMFGVGLFYRGLPLKKYPSGYQNNESVALVTSYEIPNKRLKISYSYDFTISALSFSNTTGAHEITLLYETGRSGKSVTRPTGGKIRKKF